VPTTDTHDKGIYTAEDAHKRDARKNDISQQMNSKKLQFIVGKGP